MAQTLSRLNTVGRVHFASGKHVENCPKTVRVLKQHNGRGSGQAICLPAFGPTDWS